MTVNPRRGWLLLLFCHMSMPAAVAQWPPEVVAGTRVQAKLPEAQFQPVGRRGHLVRGRVTGLAADTLYLAVTDSVGSLAIPRHLIQRLDYSRGVPSRASSALTHGVRIGAATALLLVLFDGLEEGSDRMSTETAVLAGAGVGFTLGAVVGAFRPQERWREVRVGVTVAAP
jgi:hypothetical protein